VARIQRQEDETMRFTSSAAVMRRRFVWLGMALLVLGGVGVTAPVAAGGVVNRSFLGGVAIEGTDPVAYFTESRPVEGSSDFEHEWMGASWRFVSAENRDRFAADPEKYAPQYGGYCAWAVSQGYTAKIDPEAWTIVDDKLYLNYSKDVRTQWSGDIPGNVAKGDANWPKLRADLAG
jgi:YHS domain-containing protein